MHFLVTILYVIRYCLAVFLNVLPSDFSIRASRSRRSACASKRTTNSTKDSKLLTLDVVKMKECGGTRHTQRSILLRFVVMLDIAMDLRLRQPNPRPAVVLLKI